MLSTFLQAVEILPFYKETKHFSLYCKQTDRQASDEILQVLEKNYERLAHDFEIDFPNRVKIEIYPNIKTFQEKIGLPNSGDWRVAFANEKDQTNLSRGIYLVSFNNPGPAHNKQSIFIAAVHEMTHFFIFQKSHDKLPLWMHEGLACYEAHQFDVRSLNHMLEVALYKEGIPSLALLSKYDSNSFYAAGGYSFSYTLIKFIIQKWDFKTLLRLVQEYNNFEKILGVSIEKFEAEWKEFVKQNYLTKPFNSPDFDI